MNIGGFHNTFGSTDPARSGSRGAPCTARMLPIAYALSTKKKLNCRFPTGFDLLSESW